MLRFVCLCLIGTIIVTDAFDTCSKRRTLQRLASDSTAPGYYEVQCDEEDQYVKQQCWPSTGRCWCVDQYGETIPGSHVNPGQVIDCQTIGWCSAMTSKVLEDLNGEKPPLGAPSPTCDAQGNFARSQGWGSTGQRWCAVENGNQIPGTRTGPAEAAIDCSALPACLEKEASLAHLSVDNFYPLGLDRPECSASGLFEKVQCHASTGYCWCVDPATGTETEGTRKGPGEGALTCEKEDISNTFDVETATPCERLRNTQRIHLKNAANPILGFWTVRCQEDGSFEASQCHPSTAHCWCVDQDGTEIPGSISGPGIPKVPCQTNPPTCPEVKFQQQNRNNVFKFVGMFLPECDDDAGYQSKQCWGSTGQCWCVTAQGKEIAYTRRGPTEKPDELECTGNRAPPKTVGTGRLQDEGAESSSSSSSSSSSLIAVVAVLACLLVLVSVGAAVYIKRNTGSPRYAEVNANI